MLVVKVELWPGGRQGEKREIAQAVIGNISNLADTSDYKFWITESPSTFNDVEDEYISDPRKLITEQPHSGFVLDHYRYQSVWNLVKAMLNSEE